MLYATTRNDIDPVTAHHALTEQTAWDGGLYVPMKMPSFSVEEIQSLADKSFAQIVAEMMNLLFGCHLDGWDVEFTVGRHPVRCVPMSHRIIMAEPWHNLDWDFARMVEGMTNLAAGEEVPQPGSWAKLAVGIAALFGIVGQLMSSGDLQPDQRVDVAVAAGDFTAPMAAWYARSWGLPIGNIIVCCNENSAPWDLICKGQLRTALQPVETVTPDCDRTLPAGLEWFIHACGGSDELRRYLDAVRSAEVYWPSEAVYPRMRQDTHASVVGSKRVLSAIPNLFKTNAYLPGPYTALAYSGLLDYRARTGVSGLALVLSERSPIRDGELVADALGIPLEQLEQRFL